MITEVVISALLSLSQPTADSSLDLNNSAATIEQRVGEKRKGQRIGEKRKGQRIGEKRKGQRIGEKRKGQRIGEKRKGQRI